MLKIKLDRIGKKGQPQYHVVVVEDKTNIGTRPVAKIGYYNPLTTPHEFRVDSAVYQSWVSKGARPTDTVRQLVLKNAKSEIKPVKKSTSSRPTIVISSEVEKSLRSLPAGRQASTSVGMTSQIPPLRSE